MSAERTFLITFIDLFLCVPGDSTKFDVPSRIPFTITFERDVTPIIIHELDEMAILISIAFLIGNEKFGVKN